MSRDVTREMEGEREENGDHRRRIANVNVDDGSMKKDKGLQRQVSRDQREARTRTV